MGCGTNLRSQPGGWKCRSTKGTLQAWAWHSVPTTSSHPGESEEGPSLPEEGTHVRIHHLQVVTRREALVCSTFYCHFTSEMLQAGSEVLPAGFRPFPEFSRLADEAPALPARVGRPVARLPAPEHKNEP